jgi:Uma2 family endonuclease
MTEQITLSAITLADITATDGLDEYKGLEIEDGVWVAKHEGEVMSIGHGQFGGRLFVPLWTHVDSNRLGVVYMSETIFILHVDENGVRTLRKPDTAFVSAERVKPPEASYYQQAPDLAVEIVSPTDRVGAVRKKLREYFQYGTREVWLVYPDAKEIVVHKPGQKPITYILGDVLPGGDLLPGFTLDVAFVFGVSSA